MKLGEKIKKLRKEKKIDQNEFARMVGVHFTQMSRYERGISQPTAEVIKKIATILGISTDYLLYDNIDEATGERIQDKDLLEQFQVIDKLNDFERSSVKFILEGVINNKELKKLVKR